jgi:hypothetical protein
MNLRSIQIHGSLLIVALITVWVVTHRDEEAATNKDEGVVLVQAAQGDTQALIFEKEGTTLRIESREDERGRWFWGTETKGAPPPEPEDEAGGDAPEGDQDSPDAADGTAAGDPVDDGEAATDETEPPAVEADPEVAVFVGGRAAERLWEELEPFRALRILEDLSDEKLEEFGLSDDEQSLTLVVRGKEHRFILGGDTYGSSDTYAKAADGKVVVLPAGVTRDLKGGLRRLREQRLLDITRGDVASMLLQQADATMEIIQHGAATPGKAFWARKGEEQGVSELKGWVDKLFRLRADGYLDEEPDADWTQRLSITVRSTDAEDDTVEIFAVEVDGETRYRARSKFTRMAAELQTKLAEELLGDLSGVWKETPE